MAVPEVSPVGAAPAAGLVTARFESELVAFLDDHTALLLRIHPDLAMLADSARHAVLVGGKRLRPSFAYWGWRCVRPAAAEYEEHLIRAAASLELLHACALTHDDVMDASGTRRGQPAAHVRFADSHRHNRWPGAPESFGTAGAILLGDLLLSWAEEMFTAAASQLPAGRAAAAQAQFDLMRTEVVAGQFLDVLAQTRGGFDPDEALRVIEFKTSKYTIERPLLLGAAAAGADDRTAAAFSAYGHALGEAFQLRDDLLGVFGDPSQTGKPAGDDLREGKRTLLVALACQVADVAQRQVLEAGIGNPELDRAGVAGLRTVLTQTGAVATVEERIAARVLDAERALRTVSGESDAVRALTELANAAAHRTF